MELANGCLEIFAVLVILILLASMQHEKTTDVFEKRLVAMVVCHMVVLLLDAARWFLHQRTDLGLLLTVLSAAPTILSLVSNGIFVWFTVGFLSQRGPIPRKTALPLLLLFGFGLLAWAVFILANGIDSMANMQTNHDIMRYSWGYWVGHLGWASVCIIGLWLLWRCRQGLSAKELLSLSSYCVFPLFALLLRFLWDGPQIFLSTSLSLIWIYGVIQREQRQRLWEKETQLTQSRLAILFSQIQPHFLYNTLTAICGLCDENPKEAKKVTADFADYLRHNLESLSRTVPIPFADELRHTQIYLDIEKKRFEERLQVVYSITAVDFLIPALTVQPLVENAVKHGVQKAREGGTIWISTAEQEHGYQVVITDDGVGFDPSAEQSDQRVHIGIANVRDRLGSMCKGTLEIESQVGAGARVVITIPKGERR